MLELELRSARARAAKDRRKLDTREKILAGAALKKLVVDGDVEARRLLVRVASVIQDEALSKCVAAWHSQGDGDA